MKALALERINYIKRAAVNPENVILLKLGLEVDEEYKEESPREHIWFELQEFFDDTFTAKLTQEPYYISGLSVGDVNTYGIKDITDWLIFTPEHRLSPDDAYLME